VFQIVGIMKFGRYQIIKELGKGNMGVVYKAHDPQIERQVALKVLREDRMVSEDFVLRFVKEAKAIGRLSHPNIVTVYDVGQDHGTIYIAMEYLEGKPFDEVIRGSRLEIDKVIDIGVQVAETLDYAHKKKIVHRDIKPSNMILSSEGRVKLTDFGIARIEDPTAMQQTQAGEILGTPVYMSPEQAMGTPIDGRADLYSLGVILYELIVGQRPFDGNNITAILRSIMQDRPDPPSQLDPFIPQPISDLIMKSLSRNPDDRFQSGGEMVRALENAGKGKKEIANQLNKKAKKRGRPLGVWLGAAIILLASAIGGIYFFKGKTVQKSPQDQNQQVSGFTTQGEKAESRTLTEKTVDTSDEETVGKPVYDEETLLQTERENLQEREPFPKETPPVSVTKSEKNERELIEEALPEVETSISKKNDSVPAVDEKTSKPVEIIPLSNLIIESAPTGANVYIENKFKGVTPLNLELPFGEYDIRVSLADYYEWKAELELSEEGEIPLYLNLTPLN